MIIETHAHIYDEQFDLDRDQMLHRAFDLGVEQIWMPNCDSNTIPGMLALEKQYPGKCIPMMGLHPCYVAENPESEMIVVEQWLSERPFAMIGEIGLDYFWDLSFVLQQESVFKRHLELAKKYNLPICIHSRNSKDNNQNAIIRCCELIEEFEWKDLRGIFHCFSGNQQEAERIISLNFLLGIGGVVTFKNGGLDGFLPEIGLEHLVLETDAPYLAPVPFRGKRNEVSYLDKIIEKIALLKNTTEVEVRRLTTENAKKLIKQNA